MRPGIFVFGVVRLDPGVEDGEGEEAGQAGNTGAGLEGRQGGFGLRQGQADGAGGVLKVPAGHEAAEQGAFERGQRQSRQAERLRVGSRCQVGSRYHVRV